MPSAKLLGRLIRLECRVVEHACPRYFIVAEQIPENALDRLPDGQRIVLDCYRNDRNFVEARQRVTQDPNDGGQQCAPGKYLVDVIHEIHAGCAHREAAGHCSSCIGTSVASTQNEKSRRV
jgi:hypothetical protein